MPAYLGTQYPLFSQRGGAGYGLQTSPGGFSYYYPTATGGGGGYAGPQRRGGGAGGGQGGEPGLFDADGMPTRPPRTPEEAIQFQFMAAQAARKLQERRVGQAIDTLRYGMGMALRSSPYSISAMQTPYLRDIANANLSVQYQQPDYSYFLRTGQDQGGGLPQTGVGGGMRPVFMGGGPGLNMGRQPGIANYDPFADPALPRQPLANPVAATVGDIGGQMGDLFAGAGVGRAAYPQPRPAAFGGWLQNPQGPVSVEGPGNFDAYINPDQINRQARQYYGYE